MAEQKEIDVTAPIQAIQRLKVGDELNRAVMSTMGWTDVGEGRWTWEDRGQVFPTIKFSDKDDSDLGLCFILMKEQKIALLPVAGDLWAATPVTLGIDKDTHSVVYPESATPIFVSDNAQEAVCRAFLLGALVEAIMDDDEETPPT